MYSGGIDSRKPLTSSPGQEGAGIMKSITVGHLVTLPDRAKFRWHENRRHFPEVKPRALGEAKAVYLTRTVPLASRYILSRVETQYRTFDL